MANKRKWLIFGIAALVLLALAAMWYFLLRDPARTPKGEQYAEARVQAMADAANANDPLAVYPYLTAELRALCTAEQFAKNWEEERTYPYLIPFWIFYREVTLAEDEMSGTATFERAARLPGQYENYGILYENGGYYFDAFRAIADGSYIEIFSRLA